MKKGYKLKQETLFQSSETDEETSMVDKPKLVCFRDMIPEIGDTGYLTHSTHYYPAKFIPQVARYCIEKFSEQNELIIDPFAGSGTVGLEAYICNRNSFLLDINPILNHIIPLKIYEGKQRLDGKILNGMLKDMEKSDVVFYPDWSTLDYWYPKEILDVLSRYWGWQKQLEKSIYSLIIGSALVKVSKQFSYAEHKIPKLFKSKQKQKQIKKLLQKDWRSNLHDAIAEISFETLRDINQFINLTKNNKSHITYYGGVDSSTYKFDPELQFDGLITSPPYLQAQEYIRTSKMDLFWLGYNEKEIKEFSKLEIPYRKPSRIIETETLNNLKSKLDRKDLIKIMDSYFSHTIDALEHSTDKMKEGSTACIFIGNPTADGNPVEIWRVFMEYFVGRGFSFENVYEDRIKARQLFGSRNNKNPSGMKSEYLLMLKKL